MNKVLENIYDRFSCRNYLDKEIPEQELAEILSAALSAPSARNEQKWTFTVLNNRELIQKLAKVMGKALGNENYDLYKPQVLIIPSVPKDLEYGIDDTACALENIFLAAQSFGIGSCWINQMRRVIDNLEVRELLDSFGIPKEDTIYGMAVLGYPADNSKTKIKRTGKVNFIR